MLGLINGVKINATGTKAAVEANSIITLHNDKRVEIRKKFLAYRQYKLIERRRPS